MQNKSTAISIRGLSKSYVIGADQEKHSTLAETLLACVRAPFRRDRLKAFTALNDVSFDVKQGEVVGVIGRNGAGKSTLLKVLSRITEPTTGEIQLFGRVGSLLEVGTGFHPELTGRENIFLNGAILGMSRTEIRTQFDAIVSFAGVEEFLDTPVKRYSSGMYVRLAFAVAAHLESEILIVDEVLAVGDAEFQSKCLGKMKDVALGGRTVLFVSHHMQSISALCKSGILLEHGNCTYTGPVNEAISRYTATYKKPAGNIRNPKRLGDSAELRLTAVTTSKTHFACAEPKTIFFTIERFKRYAGSYFVSCTIQDCQGVTILHCDSRVLGKWYIADDITEGQFTITTPWLKPGSYAVNFFVCCDGGILDQLEHACDIEVSPVLPYEGAIGVEAMGLGLVCPDFVFGNRNH